MDCALLVLAAGLLIKAEYSHWRLERDGRSIDKVFLRELAHDHCRPDDRANICEAQFSCRNAEFDEQARLEARQESRRKTP